MRKVAMLAVVSAVALTPLWAEVAGGASATPVCGGGGVANCLDMAGQATGITHLPAEDGTVSIVGSWDGIRVNGDASVTVTNDALLITYGRNISANGVLTGSGQLTLYTDTRVDLDVPVTVTGTAEHRVFSSTAGGTTHFVWNTTGLGESGSGTGVGAFVTQALSLPLASFTSVSTPTNPARVGQRFAINAAVCATGVPVAPSGAVQFTDTTTNTNLGSANLVTVAGQQCSTASITTSFASAGNHVVKAHYLPGGLTPMGTNPDPTYVQTVRIDNTATTVHSEVNPTTPGASTIIDLQVCNLTDTEDRPTGSVHMTDDVVGDRGTFALGTAGPGCSSAQAVLSFASTSSVTASYQPDPGYAASNASYTQTVGDMIGYQIISGPSTYEGGSGVPVKVQLCDTTNSATSPTGSVHFVDTQTATDLGTFPVGSGSGAGFTGGTPQCVYASADAGWAGPGPHAVRGTYLPGAGFVPASGTTSFSTHDVPVVTISSSANPSVQTQDVTFTVNVCDYDSTNVQPPGTVRLYDSSAMEIDQTLTLGPSGDPRCSTAALTSSTLSVGGHGMRARFSSTNPAIWSYPSVMEGAVFQQVNTPGG